VEPRRPILIKDLQADVDSMAVLLPGNQSNLQSAFGGAFFPLDASFRLPHPS